MTGAILIYIGAFFAIGWGIAHLFPTLTVVRSFGEISEDNKHIVTMEWITEGVALIFIGVLIAIVTYLDRDTLISRAVYWTTCGALNILSVVSLFTGFKISFLPYKLCPFIFTSASILIIIGSYLD